MTNVKEHVTGKQKVRFQFYRSGILFYKTEKGLLFEVPITDTGTGVFKDTDKALCFMRWIRKQLETNEREKSDIIIRGKDAENLIERMNNPVPVPKEDYERAENIYNQLTR